MENSWIALPVGIAIASIVSSIGLGGGILWMPFFLILAGLKPENAVVTSFLIQTAGMGSGTVAYGRQQKVDGRLAGYLLLVAIPGIALGAFVTQWLAPRHMEVILGLLVMTTAFLFVSSSEKYDDAGSPKAVLRKALPFGWMVSAMAVASGLLSVSIGEWLIPLMRSKLGVRMSSAIATSITVTFGMCIIGAVIHLAFGSRPCWPVIAWAVPGVICGGQIGPRITQKINERRLKEIFIFLLTLVGIHLIYNSF